MDMPLDPDAFEDALRALIDERRELKLKVEGNLKVQSYLYDPVGFFEDYGLLPLELILNEYQREILDEFYDDNRVAVLAPHSAGKSRIAAALVVHFAITREAAGINWNLGTTASSWAQLIAFLWPEIRRVFNLLDWAKLRRDGLASVQPGRELRKLSISGEHGNAFAASPRDPASIEGAHADHQLYVFDEAKAIDDAVWEAVEGAGAGAGLGGQRAWRLAISTPGPMAGVFFNIHNKTVGYEDWRAVRITLDRCIAAGRINANWVAQRARQWGERSPTYINRVLGEFCPDDTGSMIRHDWVQAAFDRYEALRLLEELPDFDATPGPGDVRTGVDIAAEGDDSTIILRNQLVNTSQGPIRVVNWWENDYTPDPELVLTEIAKRCHPANPIIIDAAGMGHHMTSMVRELHQRPQYPTPYIRVEPMHSGKPAREWLDPTGDLGANNKRSAAWFDLALALNPVYDEDRPPMAIRPDDEMMTDLVGPLSWTETGKIVVEKKKDTIKRIKRSPDKGDALVYSNWRDPEHSGATVAGLNDIFRGSLGNHPR